MAEIRSSGGRILAIDTMTLLRGFSSTLSAFALLGLAPLIAEPAGSPRDPWLQPFASDSIWNTPLGSGAKLVPAGITGATGVAIDPEILERTRPGAPERPIFQPAGWEHRAGGTQAAGSAHFNDDFIVPDARKGWTPNYSGAVLQEDGHTLENLGPVCRPQEGGPVWAYRFDRTDLAGDGIRGSHGGSGMSALGGSLRPGELLNSEPIRHALKVCLFCEKYSYYGPLRAGFRWPADRADSYAATGYKGKNPAVGMGTLLCLKPDLDLASLKLATGPARKIARALQDYGAYVVDDAAWDYFYFCAERGVREETEAALKIPVEGAEGPYHQDILKLLPLLQVVDNNAPDAIGGGGKRRAPAAPPLAAKTAAALPAHPPSNLVPNPDMERGDASPEGWSISSEDGGKAELKKETGAPFRGTASLRLVSKGKAMARIQLPGSLPAGPLTLSGRVSAGDGANAMLGLMCYAADWKPLNFVIAGNALSGSGWAAVTKKLDVPEGTAHAEVALLVEGAGYGLLDEVELLGSSSGGSTTLPVESKQAPQKAANAWSPAEGFYPDYPDAWMNFHRSLKEQAAKGGVDLLFIGDSLTLGWDKDLWAARYAPLKATNFGVGGDGTPQLLWRLEHGGFDGMQPKVMVLLIGINNVWPGYSAADTAKGIRTFVARLHKKMPDSKLLLMGMLPAFNASDSIRNYGKTVNADIATLADGRSVRFLDFGSALLDPATGEQKAGYFQPDRLHLLPPAYQAWAQAMQPTLEEWLGAAKGSR